MTSLKPLLSSIVDYAGLFPPAQLSLPEAMKIYDRAQTSPHSWMLDRFVLPASRLAELVNFLADSQAKDSTQPLSLSVILSKNWATELEQLRPFTAGSHLKKTSKPIALSTLEVAPLPPAEIQEVCSQLPDQVTSFFEIPFDAELDPYLQVLQQTNAAAKLRTGGVTPEAFPNSTQLCGRILALAEAKIPFKATAGLHHPLRSKHHLTDQADSASTTMHGFLNVAILSAFAHQQTLTHDEGIAILESTSIASFQFTDTEIHWRDRALSLDEVIHSRQFFRSFGSCSFQEPIDDLHSLNLL
ncbi:hypothetical protein [Egbenema bharatensis]|uniref:hypothetical protein n=1 Tax=Egbenema bharatensis TaxID=3463334 RepID=UPI003A89E5FC